VHRQRFNPIAKAATVAAQLELASIGNAHAARCPCASLNVSACDNVSVAKRLFGREITHQIALKFCL
jgi:hypothetical protein